MMRLRPWFALPIVFCSISLLAQSNQLNITCSSTCTGSLGENIFPGGDFGSGIPNIIPTNPNLAPGFIYTLNPPPDDGLYCIANNTTPWGLFSNLWIDIEDNGPEPNGYMMVVNATYQPGLFYQKTVDICENTPYEFSIDVINLFLKNIGGANLPNISFLINGLEVCETGDIPQDEKWHTSRFSFVSAPGQTMLTFALRNNAPGGYGNDLAIDNISLQPCGPTLATPSLLNFCAGNAVSIPVEIVNSPYLNPAYQWQIFNNGQWEDIPNSNNDTLTWSNPSEGDLIRVLVANANNNLILPNCRIISETTLLKRLPDPVINLQTQDISCFGGSDGQLSTSITQGTAPFTFLWSNGATTDTLQNATPGLYSLTVTDAIGCAGTNSATINAPSLLLSNLSGSTVSCFGGNNATASIEVAGGTAPYTYIWNNSETLDTLSNLTAGTYTVTITDFKGCSETKTVQITEPGLLTVQTDSTLVTCFGSNDATAIATASGGTTPYTFLWSNALSTASLSNLSAGTYLLTVTDGNGCTQTNAVSISEPPLLALSTNTTNISCFNGNDGTASIAVSGGTAPFSYSWNTGASTADLTGLPVGAYQATVTDALGCTALESVTLSSATLLTGNITTSHVSCFGGNNGSITVLGSGGTAPFSYTWSNGANTPDLHNLIAGNYQLTISDANGCTTIADANIFEPPSLYVANFPKNASCFGYSNGRINTVAGGGSMPFTFLWSNGETTGALYNLSAGTYQVTITDANGCTISSSATITAPDILAAQASSSDVSCYDGTDGMASTTIIGGVSPYVYSWSNGQTNAALTNVVAGNYQVTISDANGCTTTGSALITQPPALNLLSAATATTCHGYSNGAGTVVVSGGTSPYQYLWSNGQTEAQSTNLSAGTYGVTTTDNHGCTLLASVTVDQPSALEISTMSNPVSCFGGTNGAIATTLLGGTAPYHYLWNTGLTTNNASNLSAGAYQLTATDALGCTLTTQVAITQPTALEGSISSTDVNCHGNTGGSISATVTGGTSPYQFLWSNGENTSQISNLSAGLYTLKITDANACTVTHSTLVNEPAPVVLQTTLQEISCPGMQDGALNSFASGGTGPYTYLWNGGQTSSEILALDAGVYIVVATDAHGCTVSTTETLLEPSPHEVDLGDDLLIHLGDYIDLTAITSLASNQILDFTWSGAEDSLQCPYCDQYRFQPKGPGCETVLVRSKKGCKAYDTVCYKIDRRKRIYVPNVFSPNGDGDNDFFTIFSDASVKEILSLSIYNRWGGQLYLAHNIKTNDEPAGWNGTFKGQDMNIDVFVWVAEVEFIDGERIKLSGDVTLVR